MKYWIIDGDECEKYESAEDVCDYIFDVDNYDDDDALDEWINDCYYDQRCNIGGETYYPADIVKELDNYTYNELRREWAQGQSESDADYYFDQIDNMEPGEDTWINSYKIECMSDDDEKETTEEELMEAFNAIINVNYTVKTISDAPAAVQVIK